MTMSGDGFQFEHGRDQELGLGLVGIDVISDGHSEQEREVAGLPCTAVTTGAGAIFTAGPCGPRSSCAQAHVENRRSALARRIFIAYPSFLESDADVRPLKGLVDVEAYGIAKAMP